MLLAIYFAFSYFTFLSPYFLYSNEINSPLGAFELFITLECLPMAAPFIPLLALLWFADVPIVDDSIRFVIYRPYRASSPAYRANGFYADDNAGISALSFAFLCSDLS